MRETKHTRTHLALMGIFQLVVLGLVLMVLGVIL
jgi:predicted nucleic acid-binding Zn ribbon protein